MTVYYYESFQKSLITDGVKQFLQHAVIFLAWHPEYLQQQISLISTE